MDFRYPELNMFQISGEKNNIRFIPTEYASYHQAFISILFLLCQQEKKRVNTKTTKKKYTRHIHIVDIHNKTLKSLIGPNGLILEYFKIPVSVSEKQIHAKKNNYKSHIIIALGPEEFPVFISYFKIINYM